MHTEIISLKAAGAMFDDRYFNPNAVYDVFGFRPDPPPIPFSRETLETHARMGHLLVCHYDEVDGHPFRLADITARGLSGGRNHEYGVGWYPMYKGYFDVNGGVIDDPYKLPNDPRIAAGTPRPGWQLVSSDILPETRKTQAVQLVDTLIDWIERSLYGGNIPKDSQLGKALLSWNPDRLFDYREYSYPCGKSARCSGRLAACNLLYEKHQSSDVLDFLAYRDVPTLLLEPVQNAVFRHLLGYGATAESSYSRSLSSSSRGKAVAFGVISHTGGVLVEFAPDVGWSNLGAVFSRMGW